MAGEGKLRGIFLVSGSQDTAEHLAAMLPAGMFPQVWVALSAAEARRKTAEVGCDLILINTPLPDDNGLVLARDLAVRSPAGILLLVKAEQMASMAGMAEEAGVGLLPKPTSRPILQLALRLTAASAVRLRTYAQRADTLRRTVEDLRLINQAKGILISRLGMTESEAHRYIEKQAMDQGRKRREVAEQIIRTEKGQKERSG